MVPLARGSMCLVDESEIYLYDMLMGVNCGNTQIFSKFLALRAYIVRYLYLEFKIGMNPFIFIMSLLILDKDLF